MYALTSLLHNIIFLINLALFIYIVLDVLLHFDVVNRRNALVMRIYSSLRAILEPLLAPIRRFLNKIIPQSGIDLSPIILILLLKFLGDLIPVTIPESDTRPTTSQVEQVEEESPADIED